jgi:hypothetical protein
MLLLSWIMRSMVNPPRNISQARLSRLSDPDLEEKRVDLEET